MLTSSTGAAGHLQVGGLSMQHPLLGPSATLEDCCLSAGAV